MGLPLNDKLKLTTNSLIGGNIVAVAIRAYMRGKAMSAAAAFAAKRQGLAAESASLFWYQNVVAPYGAIPIDVRKQEVFTYQTEVTQHAAQDGGNFNDHAILRPIRIDLEFEVTNLTPGKAEAVLGFFEDLWRSRTLTSLQTKHKTLNNMLLTSLRADNSVPFWGSLSFSATFQQIQLVTLQTETTAPRKKKTTSNKSAPPPTDSGNRTLATPSLKATGGLPAITAY